MSQFIESIAIKDGVAKNLSGHQLRVDRTLMAFAVPENRLDLSFIIANLNIPLNGLFKLRIVYDLNGAYHAEWANYQYKAITSFALVDIKGQSYHYKFANRDWITDSLKQSGRDEIVMHDGGLIKDCSYTNIVFNDGVNWYTPESPLLEGTQRASLIKEGVIKPVSIRIETISLFQSFKLINAMMDWENAIEYSVSLIV
jgi:4-amino-4-deoxychorismate lyase